MNLSVWFTESHVCTFCFYLLDIQSNTSLWTLKTTPDIVSSSASQNPSWNPKLCVFISDHMNSFLDLFPLWKVSPNRVRLPNHCLPNLFLPTGWPLVLSVWIVDGTIRHDNVNVKYQNSVLLKVLWTSSAANIMPYIAYHASSALS